MTSNKLFGAMGIVVTVAMLGTTLASAAPVRFGAKLAANTFPSNAAQGQFCNEPDGPPHPKCTWVEMRAFNSSANGHKAPKDGTIGKIRLISCIPGSFKLQIARAKAKLGQAKVVREGPIIKYQGDANDCDDSVMTIETFAVNVKVKKGDVLAIKTTKTGMLRCDSGGAKILLFDPPLIKGAGVEEATDDSGCYLLLQAEYK